MSLVDELHEMNARALEELSRTTSREQLENWRIAYLGSKGALKTAMGRLKDIPREEKGLYGKVANIIKDELTKAFAAAQETIGTSGKAKAPGEDVTLPGEPPQVGHKHIITQTIDELCDIFGRMGFETVYGPEVEDEQHNFVDLNIPPEHPARDTLENFIASSASLADRPFFVFLSPHRLLGV